MKKENSEGRGAFLLILFSSFIGFIIYIIISHGDTGSIENNESFSEIDELIKREEKAEFYDVVEEISEDVIEDVIDNVLDDIKIKSK
ncbi:MAG: hypothetical protein ACFE9S_04490 [Candidatus Hermodarchaeota archaeon]